VVVDLPEVQEVVFFLFCFSETGRSSSIQEKWFFVVVFWNRDLRQRAKSFRLFFGVVGSRRGSRNMD
jgi:hypothetical protein